MSETRDELSADQWTERPPPAEPLTADAMPEPPRDEAPHATRRPKPRQTVSIDMLLGLLGPFSGMLSQLGELLERYRQEGKMPALLMAVVGGLALVLGSAYLLQYSFHQWQSEWAKITIVAVVSVGVTGAGVWVSLRKEEMAEYGASVMAVGLTIGYLTVYFAGPYYHLVSAAVEMLAVAAITAVAYLLALRFETRVTTTLMLIGGAFAPLLVASGQPESLAYGSLLALLAVAGVHIALRINWRALLQTTFVLTVGPFEYAIWDGPAGSLGLIGITHALFYLYVWAVLFDGLRIRDAADQLDLITIAANLMFFLWTLWGLAETPPVQAGLLALNALPFAAVVASGVSRSRKLSPLFVLMAGVLVAVAVLAWFGAAYRAVLWALEGTLLVYLGLRYDSRSVRLEGVLLVGAGLAWSAAALVEQGGVRPGSLDDVWQSLLGTFILLSVAVWLFEREILPDLDHRLMRVLTEVQSAWFAGLFMYTAWLLWSDGAWVLAVVPMYALLYRSSTRHLRLSEYLAWLHVAFLTLEIVIGASTVGTFHFMQQPLTAQVARVELLASLWVWSWFYRHFYAEGHFARATAWTREGFFLLVPMLLLPMMWRRFPEWFPCVLWLSCVMAWELQRRVELRFMHAEHLLLVGVASVVSLAAEFGAHLGMNVHGVPPLLIGGGYYVWLLYRERGLRPDFAATYEPLFVGAFGYFGAVVFALAFHVSDNVAFGFSLAAIGFFAALMRRPVLRPLRPRLRIVYVPGALTALLACLALPQARVTPIWVLLAVWISTAVFAGVQLVPHPHARAARSGAGRPMFHAMLHMSIVVAYVFSADWLGLDAGGVATSVLLVVHATSVLFLTLRRRFADLLWLSLSLYAIAALKVIGYDLAGFSLVEKIVAFMVIGGVLLVAAYQYQVLRNRVAGTTNDA